MTNDTDEISLTLGAIAARMSRERLLRLIQLGEVRGRFDPDRPMTLGRWFVSRDDCERLRTEKAAVTVDA